jgi:hypothetical protein
MVDHLCDFVVPYQHCLETEAGKRNVHLYLAGLLSHLERKNAEEIAALVDVERLVMQQFIRTAPWDQQFPLIAFYPLLSMSTERSVSSLIPHFSLKRIRS